MDGREIKDTSELENGGQYVAVGHGKKYVQYNIIALDDHNIYFSGPYSSK